MKKQTAVVVSFSALLTLSALAPKVLWQEEKHNVNRFPASEEAITPPKKSLYEMREMDKHLEKKIEVKKEEAQVSCLKDKQPSALEDEIKKLMADKEAIMKEIADLKKSKEEPVIEHKDKKEVSRFTEKEDFVSLVSQMTSMMITQQQQQQMLMEQMFSMMNQMQMQMPQNQQQNFMSPYAFEGSYPQAIQGYPQAYPSLGDYGVDVGLKYEPQQHGGYPQVQAYQNPYAIQMDQSQMRAPSAQNEPAFMQRELNVQPQLQSQYPAGNYGYDFLSSSALQEMARIQF